MVIKLNNEDDFLKMVIEECDEYPFPSQQKRDPLNSEIPLLEDVTTKTCLDVGCNVGGFVLSKSNKIEQFYCVDASEENIKQAKINTKDLNNKITFARNAVDAESGKIVTLRPYILPDNTICSSGSFSTVGYTHEDGHGWKDSEHTEEVETISIEKLVEDACLNMNVSEIDLLKVDIEGSEYNFLMNKDLSLFKFIIIEYHNFLTKITADGFNSNQQKTLENHIKKTHELVQGNRGGYAGEGEPPHWSCLYMKRKDI